MFRAHDSPESHLSNLKRKSTLKKTKNKQIFVLYSRVAQVKKDHKLFTGGAVSLPSELSESCVSASFAAPPPVAVSTHLETSRTNILSMRCDSLCCFWTSRNINKACRCSASFSKMRSKSCVACAYLSRVAKAWARKSKAVVTRSLVGS